MPAIGGKRSRAPSSVGGSSDPIKIQRDQDRWKRLGEALVHVLLTNVVYTLLVYCGSVRKLFKIKLFTNGSLMTLEPDLELWQEISASRFTSARLEDDLHPAVAARFEALGTDTIGAFIDAADTDTDEDEVTEVVPPPMDDTRLTRLEIAVDSMQSSFQSSLQSLTALVTTVVDKQSQTLTTDPSASNKAELPSVNSTAAAAALLDFPVLDVIQWKKYLTQSDPGSRELYLRSRFNGAPHPSSRAYVDMYLGILISNVNYAAEMNWEPLNNRSFRLGLQQLAAWIFTSLSTLSGTVRCAYPIFTRCYGLEAFMIIRRSSGSWWLKFRISTRRGLRAIIAIRPVTLNVIVRQKTVALG
eukprot:gene7672-biopygen4788